MCSAPKVAFKEVPDVSRAMLHISKNILGRGLQPSSNISSNGSHPISPSSRSQVSSAPSFRSSVIHTVQDICLPQQLRKEGRPRTGENIESRSWGSPDASKQGKREIPRATAKYQLHVGGNMPVGICDGQPSSLLHTVPWTQVLLLAPSLSPRPLSSSIPFPAVSSLPIRTGTLVPEV